MNKRKILIGLAYLVGGVSLLGLGFFWGYKEGLVYGGFSASMAELQQLNDSMMLQLREGTCETARKAINAHEAFQEKYKGKNNLIMPEHTYYADKMLGHMKLFLIERHEGNSVEAQRHVKLAATACQHAEMKNCTETNIIRMAEKWNQNQPMACLGSDK